MRKICSFLTVTTWVQSLVWAEKGREWWEKGKVVCLCEKRSPGAEPSRYAEPKATKHILISKSIAAPSTIVLLLEKMKVKRDSQDK